MARKIFSRKIAIFAILIILGGGSWVSTYLFADTVDTLKKQLLKLQMVISYA